MIPRKGDRQSDPESFDLATEALFIARTGVGYDGLPVNEQPEFMSFAVAYAVSSIEGRDGAVALAPKLT